MMRILLYVSLLFALKGLLPVSSQEILRDLEVNRSVKEQYLSFPRIKSTSGGLLELPFFDDFSGTQVYPDHENWSDRNVFINSDYAVNPVSIGTATFDAIDHTGSLYEQASVWPFISDFLTSRPVNMDFPPEDSIYLSFFYQPQGKGDVPQTNDSLRLEFYSPETETWRVVWSAAGDSLHDFRLVMLPVTSPEYLKENFRFRFSNIASLADNRFNPGAKSNCDHWHIDYVYLDRGRTAGDSVFSDIAFVSPLSSLLNNYESMPWKHFQAGRVAEMGSVIPVTYINNDRVTRSADRHFSVQDVYENRIAYSFSGGTANIPPTETQNYSPPLAYSFNTDVNDSALFRIKAWLTTDDFDRKSNDTISYYQKFSNYFALDDGTAENGYGLFGGGTENAKIAYRFRTYTHDSLRAIKIYFNQSLNDASRQYFHIAVWDDDGGQPGELLYSSEGLRPVYEESLNRFHTYYLDSALYISGIFHTGIIQTSNEFLNIGWDINNDNSNRIFYNIYGQWQKTSFEGSLMIRPVVGSPLSAPVNETPAKSGLKVYPNPAVNYLFIELETETDLNSVVHKLYNRLGQMVYQGTGNEYRIDLSNLPPGIYFLRTETKNSSFKTKKILITQ